MAVVVEGEEVDTQGGARIDVDADPGEDAGAAFGSTSSGVHDGGVPVVVEIVVWERIAGVGEEAVSVGGQQVVWVLRSDGEGGGGIRELVGEAGHGVSGRDVGRGDVDEGVAAGGEGETVLAWAEGSGGVAGDIHIDGHRLHAGAVVRLAREDQGEGNKGSQSEGGDQQSRQPGSRCARLGPVGSCHFDFEPPMSTNAGKVNEE